MVERVVFVANFRPRQSSSHQLRISFVVDLRAFAHFIIPIIYPHPHQPPPSPLLQLPQQNQTNMGCDQSSPSAPTLPNGPKASKYSPVQEPKAIKPDPIIHNQQVLQNEEDSSLSVEGDPDCQSMVFSKIQDKNSEEDGSQELQQNRSVSQPKQFLQPNQIFSKVVAFELEQNINNTKIDHSLIVDTDSLLSAIRMAISSDKWLHSLIGKEDIQSLSNFIHKNALNRQQEFEMVQLFLSLLRKKKQLKDNITYNEYHDVWEEIRGQGAYETKLREIIESQNKKNLRHLQYFMNPKTQKKSIYGYCFSDLLFDSTFSQLQKVLGTVVQMLPQNPNSFCLLLTYLLNCCYSLQQNGISASSIQDKLKQQFNQIQGIFNQNRSKYSLGAENNQKSHLENSKKRDLAAQKHLSKKNILAAQQKVYFELTESNESRQQQLHSFIKKRINEASQKYRYFCKFLTEITKQTNNYFVIEELNTSRSNLISIEDKIIDFSLQKLQPDQTVGIDQFIEKECSHIDKQKQAIYKLIEGQIEFRVSCLSASCWFGTIKEINQLIEKIQREAQGYGYLVTEIKNKLSSDNLRESIVYILKQGVKCQIRLLLIDNISYRTIRGYIEQLVESKRYSLFTAIKQLNDRLTTLYYSQLSYFVSQKKLKLRQMYHIPLLRDKLHQLITYRKVEIKGNDLVKSAWFDWAKTQFLQIYQLQPRQQLSKIFSISAKLYYKAARKEFKAVEDYFRQFQQELQKMRIQMAKTKEESDSTDRKANLKALCIIQLPILKQIARNLMFQENYGKAIDVWQRYTKIIKLSEAGSSLEAIESIKMMAQCQHRVGNYNLELQQLQKCLFQIEDKPYFAKQKYRILNSIGEVYSLQGCNFKTLQTFNRVAQACLSRQIQDNRLQSQTLKNIGLQFHKTGDYQQALLYFSKSLLAIENQTGNKSIETVPILRQIASTLKAKGEHSASLENYNQILDIIVASKGEASLETVDPLYGIANIYLLFKQYRQVEIIYMNCLRIIEKHKGKTSVQYGQCCQKLGEIYLQSKDYSLSLKYFFKALSIKQKTYGKDTIDSFNIIQKIITNYEQQRNHKQEDYYVHRLTNIMQRQKINESPNKINTFNNIAHNSLIRGNYPVALNYYAKALKILQGAKGRDSIEGVAIHKQMGAAYQAQENYKASLEQYHQCLTVLERQKGKENMERAEVLYQMGCVQEAQNNNHEAQEYFREAIYLCKKHKVKYVVYAMSCFRLAKILQEYKNFQEAQQLFRQCLPILDKIGKKQAEEVKQKIEKYCQFQGLLTV